MHSYVFCSQNSFDNISEQHHIILLLFFYIIYALNEKWSFSNFTYTGRQHAIKFNFNKCEFLSRLTGQESLDNWK